MLNQKRRGKYPVANIWPALLSGFILLVLSWDSHCWAFDTVKFVRFPIRIFLFPSKKGFQTAIGSA